MSASCLLVACVECLAFSDLIHSNRSYTTVIQIFLIRALWSLNLHLQAKQLVDNLSVTAYAHMLGVLITWWDTSLYRESSTDCEFLRSKMKNDSLLNLIIPYLSSNLGSHAIGAGRGRDSCLWDTKYDFQYFFLIKKKIQGGGVCPLIHGQKVVHKSLMNIYQNTVFVHVCEENACLGQREKRHNL